MIQTLCNVGKEKKEKKVDEDKLKLEKYLEDMDEITSEEYPLCEYFKYTKDIQSIYSKLKKGKKVSIEELRDLSRCHSLQKFALESKGQNFNDFFERLDDSIQMENSAISDMNSVADFFWTAEKEFSGSR